MRKKSRPSYYILKCKHLPLPPCCTSLLLKTPWDQNLAPCSNPRFKSRPRPNPRRSRVAPTAPLAPQRRRCQLQQQQSLLRLCQAATGYEMGSLLNTRDFPFSSFARTIPIAQRACVRICTSGPHNGCSGREKHQRRLWPLRGNKGAAWAAGDSTKSKLGFFGESPSCFRFLCFFVSQSRRTRRRPRHFRRAECGGREDMRCPGAPGSSQYRNL